MNKIYFISGVCGVGKTSVLGYLQDKLDKKKYDMRDFDERGVPDGGGLEWLKKETRHWLNIAKDNAKEGKSTIVCGFANPELFSDVHQEGVDISAQIILLDASADTIRIRIKKRHDTPKSIKEIERAAGVSLNEFIESNAKFSTEFREIFEKRNLPIIQTDNLTPEEVSQEVVKIIEGY